ncbi:MAG: NADH-quinone oxidoreductase subunit A [Desulfobacterota bacterium]|nr:NADH-quinone oxidoreductase subunit A [Thermodesulfobacteriota bacterium]
MFSQMVQAGLDEFLFVFVFFLVGLVLPLSMVIINYVLGPRTRGERRLASYESGMPPIGTAWMQFGASYYIFCLIFLAFDVDVLYLFPVLIAYQRSTGAFELLELFIFLLLIGLAITYAWRKGAFKWR